MATPLETGINWGTQIDSDVITYYFAEEGEVYDGVFCYEWVDYEIQQFWLAFRLFKNFLNVTFKEVNSGEDFTLVSGDDDDVGALGYFYPPGQLKAGIGVFNWQGLGWDYDLPGKGVLEQGGYGFITIIHELGHGLGLAHPHDNGGASTIFPGVSSPFGDYGDFDLNQGVWTMMSYNDGWKTNPHGGTADGAVYGFQGTPMAIDIAVLQAKYGANMSYHTGDDTYELPSANGLGTFYSCIWDAGGIDTIVHNGSNAALIDLRPATLKVGVGGGGFLSYVNGVFGGFTIAKDVVIENATGGSGEDALIGNAAANILDGRGGKDILEGGAGNDTYVLGADNDTVSDSSGIDTITSTITRSLVSYADIENLTLLGTAAINGTGNWLNNKIVGNGAANVLSGGLGLDELTGRGGFDSFLFDVKPIAANVDHVTDMVHKADEIWLDKSFFKKLKVGDLKKKAFYKGKDVSAAKDAKDRIIYDKKSGECYYDQDGVGGKNAKLFAILDDSPNNINHKDFLVVA